MNATNTLCLFNLFVCKNFLLQWRTVLVKVVYLLQLRTNVTIVLLYSFYNSCFPGRWELMLIT